MTGFGDAVRGRGSNLKVGAHGERGARAYKGAWGGAPSGVQGQSPWSGGQGGTPLKLKGF